MSDLLKYLNEKIPPENRDKYQSDLSDLVEKFEVSAIDILMEMGDIFDSQPVEEDGRCIALTTEDGDTHVICDKGVK